MIQGIGNPLVAVYARCYLCRVGISISTPGTDMKYLVKNFTNFLDCYNHVNTCHTFVFALQLIIWIFQLFSRSVKQELATQKLELPTYMTLFTPALDFILQAVASDAPENLLADLLQKCSKQGNRYGLI